MAEHTIQKWVETAVRQMHFRPDRKYIRQELWDHLLDSRDCRVEQGMDLKEAEEAAVKAMGDPVETGKLLNKVHRPILSQLWWASRWCLISILCISIGAAVQYEKHDIFNWGGLLPSLEGRIKKKERKGLLSARALAVLADYCKEQNIPYAAEEPADDPERKV